MHIGTALRFSGRRVREARGALKAEHLAAACNVSVSTIRNWEHDRCVPSANDLFRLARSAGKDLEWFFEPGEIA